MNTKKLLALVLAVMMVVSVLAGCGGKTETPAEPTTGADTPAQGGQAAEGGDVVEEMAAAGVQTANAETGNTQKTDETLVVQLSGYPDFFWHPGMEGQMGTNEEQIINAALLDRLVEYDEVTNTVVPSLAESWEQNGAEFTFKLRSGVKMTDGSELCADDVVYTAGLWVTNCASNDTGKYIVEVKKVDDMTVTITFNSEAPDIIKMLTWANFGIVSEDEVNAVGGPAEAAKNPVMGSGRYRFVECKQGEYVILERNEEYWDSNYFGYFKTIKLTFVNDPNAKVSAVMSGDAHVAYDLPVAQANSFVENNTIRTYIYPNGEVEHLFFNHGEGHPTSDIRVRQAIAKLLNYPAIASIATAGYGQAVKSYVATGASYYTEGWTDEEITTIDVEGAKALLKEAGYDESNPLKLTTVTLPDLMDIYVVIQANLREAGVELEIAQVDMGGFVPAMLFEKSYDIIAVGDNALFRTPQLPQFVSPGVVFGGPNAVFEDHIAILTKLMNAKDDTEAKAALDEYQTQLKNDLMCVNMYEILKSSIVGADIKGFAIRERAYVDLTTMYK